MVAGPLGTNPPAMGVVAVFDDEEASRRMQRYEARLQQAARATQKFAEESQRSTMRMRKTDQDETRHMLSNWQQFYNAKMALRNRDAQNTENALAVQLKSLRTLRWQMMTLLFFMRIFSKAMQAGWEEIQEAAEARDTRAGVQALANVFNTSMQSIVQQLMSVAGGTMDVREAISLVQAGLLQDQGRFAEEYVSLWKAAATGAEVSTAGVQDIFEELIETLAGGSESIGGTVDAIFEVTYAMEQYAVATGRTVDQLSEQERINVTLQAVYSRTDELLDSGVRTLLEQRQSVDRLGAAWTTFTGTFSESLIAFADSTDIIESVTGLINTMTQAALLGVSTIAGVVETMRQLQVYGPIGLAIGVVADPQEALRAYAEGFENVFKKGIEAMGIFDKGMEDLSGTTREYGETVEETGEDLDQFVEKFLSFEDIQLKHQQRIDKIWEDYERARTRAERNFNRKVADIERDAQRARDRAWRRYYRKLGDLQEDTEQERRSDLEKHLMRMRHLQEQFNLRSIQNERMYQYERGLLVAEGDVLAIEDLDARYALEQQAAKENLDLQLRQMDEMFRLQEKYQREADRRRIDDLRKALQDELAEIEEQRSDRLEQARETLADSLQIAKENLEERLDAEQKSYERSIQMWAGHWAEMAAKAKMGSEEVIAALRAYFGPGALADQIIAAFVERQRQIAWIQMRVSMAMEMARGTTRTPPLPTVQRPGTVYPQQFGGEGMVTRPTAFIAGEAGPEYFKFQPVSTIGGSIAVQWQGGPIQVHGTGEMQNVNVTELGNRIAQGIVVEMQSGLSRMRGERG